MGVFGLNVLKQKCKSFFSGPVDVKIIAAGTFCSYSYVSGCWLYWRFKDYKGEYKDAAAWFYTRDFISRCTPSLMPLLAHKDFVDPLLQKLQRAPQNLNNQCISHWLLCKVTNNVYALDSLVNSASARDVLNPLVQDVLNPQGIIIANQKVPEPDFLVTLKLNSLRNLVKNTKVEYREWPYDDIKRLALFAKKFKASSAQESVANIIHLLLENKENAIKVMQHEFEEFQSCSLIKDENRRGTDSVIAFLYTTRIPTRGFASMLWEAFPTMYAHAQCIKLLNEHSKDLSLFPRGYGVTLFPDLRLPEIATAWYYRWYNTARKVVSETSYALMVSYTCVFLGHLIKRRPNGITRLAKIQETALLGLDTCTRLMIFQGIYKMQDQLLNSRLYLQNVPFMFGTSALVTFSTWASLSLLSARGPCGYFLERLESFSLRLAKDS